MADIPVHVRCLPEVVQAVHRASEITGWTRTDVINQAVLLFERLASEQLNGWEVRVARDVPGTFGLLNRSRAVRLHFAAAEEEGSDG